MASPLFENLLSWAEEAAVTVFSRRSGTKAVALVVHCQHDAARQCNHHIPTNHPMPGRMVRSETTYSGVVTHPRDTIARAVPVCMSGGADQAQSHL